MKKSQIPDVRLGFEVPTGDAVDIPVRHTVIVGQTQESGKTTTLEALITRSGLRAVTFVTKRGEGSFTGARRVQPYFREKADWQYVAAILEASRGERMKMERSFIIRASKGAMTLGQVHSNIKGFLKDPKLRGLAADMYLCLDAYLEVVVPTIASVHWAEALILAPGVNAVDLTDVPDEMQHLVIQSSIDWVLQHETDTIVVIPEAWKFVPEGRKTPVKQSAVALIRQGAALRNYVWLDSQDIGGISKEILRSCPVWLLGVQRETNEIKRTLDNIPDGLAKPKKADIATLTIGQFYACWGSHAVKTYVQPTWIDAGEAVAVARASVLTPLIMNSKPTPKEPEVTPAEADRLTQENAELRESNARLQKANDILDDTIGGMQRQIAELKELATAGTLKPRDAQQGRILAGHPSLIEKRPTVEQVEAAAAPITRTAVPDSPMDHDTESLYRMFKERLLSEVNFSGAKVVQLVPAAKLRMDFQQAETDLILTSVRALTPMARKTLKLLESIEGAHLSQRQINTRLGRSETAGDMKEIVKTLTKMGLVHINPKTGVGARVRAKIAEDLATYSPEESAVDDCHQAVLHALATEA